MALSDYRCATFEDSFSGDYSETSNSSYVKKTPKLNDFRTFYPNGIEANIQEAITAGYQNTRYLDSPRYRSAA